MIGTMTVGGITPASVASYVDAFTGRDYKRVHNDKPDDLLDRLLKCEVCWLNAWVYNPPTKQFEHCQPLSDGCDHTDLLGSPPPNS
jgi:hypothetical protein